MRYKQPYSLYKRGKYYYYRTYTPGGVRTSGISTGCTSKAAARGFCDNLYKNGGLYTDSKLFKEYASGFFDANGLYFRDKIKKPAYNTVYAYNNILKNHILPYFENLKLNDINYSKIKSFRVHLVDNGLASSSITQIMNDLKIIIDFAYRDRIILDNPFNYIKNEQIEKNNRDAFTLEEVRFIYKNISAEYKPIVLFIALTGVRISEYRALYLSEVIRLNSYNLINITKQYIRGSQTVEDLKTQYSRRPCLFIPGLEENIKSLTNTELVYFYKELGQVIESMKGTEGRELACHSLRHFFITNTKARGCPDIKIEFLAGHSLKGVRAVYTNFKAEDLTEVINWQKEIYQEIIKE